MKPEEKTKRKEYPITECQITTGSYFDDSTAYGSKNMQPKEIPIEKKYEDFRQKRSEEGKKAVEEMMKRPYSYQEASENLDKLRAERFKLEAEEEAKKKTATRIMNFTPQIKAKVIKHLATIKLLKKP